MAKSRWSVRQCEHGHLTSAEGTLICPECPSFLSDSFDVVVATGARSSDPNTSKQAALLNEPRRDSQRWKALEAIRRHPMGLTALEVQRYTKINGVWKRISELKTGGHVVVIGSRVDPETKAPGEVYVAAHGRVHDIR